MTLGMMVLFIKIGPLMVIGWVDGSAVGVGPRKKKPPSRERASETDRYEASL